MAEIRFRRCHGPYFFSEKPRKRDRKSCPKDGQQNVKGRIRHWGCHRPCGHAQDGLEKNVHIRTFFQKDRILKIFVSCPFFFEKWLLTHVWAGIRVKNPPAGRPEAGFRPLAPTSQILMRNERSVKQGFRRQKIVMCRNRTESHAKPHGRSP